MQTTPDVRRKRILTVPPMAKPALDPAVEWTEGFDEGERSAFFAVLGASHYEREVLYRNFPSSVDSREWLTRSPLQTLQAVVEHAGVDQAAKDTLPPWWPPPSAPWGLLWALATLPDVLIEDPLRDLMDMQFSLAHDLFRGLWEIRFNLREQGDLLETNRLVTAMGTWLLGHPLDSENTRLLEHAGIQRKVGSDAEKIDTLCILLLMAAQNGLVRRLYLAFDDLERADRTKLKELLTVLQGVSRWAKVPGMPLGLFLGWNGDGAKLGKANARLAALIVQGIT